MGELLHLLTNAETGETREACHACVAKDEKLASQARELQRFRNEETERLGLAPDAAQIMEVLTFHRQLLGGRVIRGKAAWKAVKGRFADIDAETDKPAFTVLHLKAAVVGLSLSRWHREHKKTGAAWLFADPDRVQEFIGACVAFKRTTGESALEIVDELMGPGLVRLAAHCSDCGHMLLDHERQRPELDLWDPPCAVHGCACGGWDDRDWRDELWLAGRAS